MAPRRRRRATTRPRQRRRSWFTQLGSPVSALGCAAAGGPSALAGGDSALGVTALVVRGPRWRGAAAECTPRPLASPRAARRPAAGRGVRGRGRGRRKSGGSPGAASGTPRLCVVRPGTCLPAETGKYGDAAQIPSLPGCPWFKCSNSWNVPQKPVVFSTHREGELGPKSVFSVASFGSSLGLHLPLSHDQNEHPLNPASPVQN